MLLVQETFNRSSLSFPVPRHSAVTDLHIYVNFDRIYFAAFKFSFQNLFFECSRRGLLTAFDLCIHKSDVYAIYEKSISWEDFSRSSRIESKFFRRDYLWVGNATHHQLQYVLNQEKRPWGNLREMGYDVNIQDDCICWLEKICSWCTKLLGKFKIFWMTFLSFIQSIFGKKLSNLLVLSNWRYLLQPFGEWRMVLP